jgi:hypothetical protein
LDLADSAFVVETDDIESYRWTDQVITLTTAASARLWNTFGSEGLFTLACVKGVFVVALGDRKLYGGVFDEIGSQAAIRFPVIYLDKRRHKYVLTLRPWHDFRWTAEVYRGLDPERRQVLERAEVWAFFEERNKLTAE